MATLVTKPDELYEPKPWGSSQILVCKECGFDSTNEATMIDHVRIEHAERFERPVKRSEARRIAAEEAKAKTAEIALALKNAAAAQAKAEKVDAKK